ncbi:hypothetical protein CSB45_01780 [candidate division KSB3 bacterium]|uniref:HTH tetR-type domain-containing protein n=1 Tax=candidate division KSB3 bacterium TaxID=2044937 RepID=A0A2G6EAP2_9BACT|nr:MAG: hypothetical protein CSB45_01780 [candidate division KSB3 bacterium]PIE30682.1 MAG: hypothetical protein CSA57_01565 [candidate division KSB3 bacterium]
MQFKKADVEKALLKAARAEFLAHGFKDASIRTIAGKAGVARSNLYNYFASKDALFTALVQPTLDEIRDAFTLAWEMMISAGNVPFPSLEHELAEGRLLVEFIDSHRENLTLILLKSQGSSVEGFIDYVQEEYQKMHSYYFDSMKARFPEKFPAGVSPFFMHTLSAWALNIVMEFISHDIPLREMLNYIEQFTRFYYHGLLGLMES